MRKFTEHFLRFGGCYLGMLILLSSQAVFSAIAVAFVVLWMAFGPLLSSSVAPVIPNPPPPPKRDHRSTAF